MQRKPTKHSKPKVTQPPYQEESKEPLHEEQNPSFKSPPQRPVDPTTERTVNDSALSREEVLDLIAKSEAESAQQFDKQSRAFYERVQRLENEVAEARKSASRAELAVLNAVGKHISVLDGALKEGVEKLHEFFQNLPELENRVGKFGAYETVLSELRSAQSVFSVCQVELNAQKMELNRIVEIMRAR